MIQSSKAQITSITGFVTNTANEPLLGNIIILASKDSLFINATTFNSTFKIDGVNKSDLLLKFTALNYLDTVIQVSYNGKAEVNIGTIVMKQKITVLSNVVVNSRTQLVRYLANGVMEVNVDKTILSSSSSVTEILSRSPNVIESNGQLSIIGKGEALLFLNGVLITPERLAAIPVSQVLKVEIIPNPSAKYDAEGKAVINIITKQKIEQGTLGTVTQQATYSDFAGANTQTFLDASFAKNNLSIQANYSLLIGNNREFLHTTRTRPLASEFFSSDLNTDWRRKLNNYSNYGMGLRYVINNTTNFTLAYSGFTEKMGGNIFSNNVIKSNVENSVYKSTIDKAEGRQNNAVTFNFNKALDTLGSSLFIGTIYSNFNYNNNDFITENRTVNTANGIRLIKNFQAQNIDVLSSQIDYTKVLRSNKKIETGVKMSYVNTSSKITFDVSDNGSPFMIDPSLSNNFSYKETIAAAYFNYGGRLKKINYTVGLRTEFTEYSLSTSVGVGQLLSNRYINFFPNLQLNTDLSKTTKLNFSYSARITRPRYQALNPYVIYQDAFTTTEGNPNLVPERTHAFELGLTKRKYDIRLGYTYSMLPMDAAALRGTNPNSYILKAINLQEGHRYFAALSHTINYKSFTSINTANISYANFTTNEYDFVTIDPSPQLYFNSNNTYNIKKLFKIQLLGWYNGRRKYGIYDDFSRFLILVGIEKDVFKNKLQLRLLANDIFSRTNASGVYNVGRTDIFYDRRFNNSYFRFIAKWSFGKLKKSDYRIRAIGQTENGRAN